MQVAELIAAGSSQFGWPVIEPDPSRGYYELTFDELKVRVSATDRNNASILLVGILSETIPSNETERNAFFGKVLTSNLAHAYSQRESVALSPAGDQLILWRKLAEAQTTIPEFFLAMEGFLNSFENWRPILQSGKTKESSDESIGETIPTHSGISSRFTNITP